jgi:hypothetical protein
MKLVGAMRFQRKKNVAHLVPETSMLKKYFAVVVVIVDL